MSKELIDLATEVADARETDVPHKLLKLRGIYKYKNKKFCH